MDFWTVRICNNEHGSYYLFWRSALRPFSSKPDAARFLETIESDPGADDLRSFARENPALGIPEAIGDADLLDRAAYWLVSGTALALLESRDLYWTPPLAHRSSRTSIQRFLQTLTPTRAGLGNLRRFASTEAAGGLSAVDDETLRGTVATWIATGQAALGFRYSVGGTTVEKEEIAGPAAAPAGQAVRDSASPEPEGPTFDPDHDAGAQANALVAAAQSGVPFCEECERARQAQNRQGAP